MTVELEKDELGDAAADVGVTAAELGAATAVLAGIAAGLAVPTAGWGAGVAGIAAGMTGITAAFVGLAAGALALAAADPPRYDYHLVAKFSPGNVRLPGMESIGDSVWNEFNKNQMEFDGAIKALVISFERLAGARLDLRKPGANADQLARCIRIQRQAIKYNAKAAKKRIQTLLKLRRSINIVWHPYAELLRANSNAIWTVNRLQANATLWHHLQPVFQKVLGDDEWLGKIKQLVEQAKFNSFDIPDEILSNRWRQALLNVEKKLATLEGERILPPQHEIDRYA